MSFKGNNTLHYLTESFLQVKEKAAVKIQTFFRECLQRKHAKERESSAIIIQKYARGFLARKQALDLKEEKRLRAAKIVRVSF